MRKIKIMFLGCGFLATHIIPHILPFSKEIILIDRERIEKVNYENCIYPKGYTGKRKVSALTALIQILSSIPVVPIHINIKSPTSLKNLETKPDFCFVTFDNIEARLIAKEYALETGVPALFIGVTENYIYIDWENHVELPDSPHKIEKVKKEMKRIRDICSRLEFRGLGVLAAGYAYYAFTRWIEKGEKLAFIVSTKENIKSACLKRK